MLTRKDVNALSPEELQTYIHALDVLKQRSKVDPEDPTGYDYQARIHNDQDVGPCEHGNDLFFPWHRCHLYHFEQLLKAADPPHTLNVTIPYWDWSRPDPNGGRYPRAFSLEGLSAFRSDDGPALPGNTLKIVTDPQTWNEFAGWPKDTPEENYGAFELGPHNFMHGTYIGGLMGDPATAADDPIYWSFHAFIDLMWAEWQRRNPVQRITSLDAVLRGFQHLKTHQRVRDFVGLYDYSQTLADDLLTGSPVATPQRIGIARPLFEGSVREQFRRGPAVFALSGFAKQRRMILKFNGMNLPQVASYTVRAYILPQGADASKMSSDQMESAFAGYLAVWKAHRNNHLGAPNGEHRHEPAREQHHPPAVIGHLDVTEAVRRARAGGQDNLVASLVFTPNALPSGVPAATEEVYRQLNLTTVELWVVQ